MAALQKALGHSPQRAQELREICEGSTFSAHQLWPKLHLVVTVTGGNFEASTRRWGKRQNGRMHKMQVGRWDGGEPFVS